MPLPPDIQKALQRGLVIPALPLALDAARKLDERRQRALLRYYAAAGAGGVAVGVHTTQFAIRDARFGLFEPLLRLALRSWRARMPGGASPWFALAASAARRGKPCARPRCCATLATTPVCSAWRR